MSENEMLHIKTQGSETFGPDWDGIASLNSKLANVMGSLSTLPKDGEFKFGSQKWGYISYSAVADACRAALALEGIAFFFSVLAVEQKEWGNNGLKSIVDVEATFADGATGAFKVVYWKGEAVDFGAKDKGMSKAYTAATKYGLMRSLLISSEDDVEPDASPKQSQKGTNQKASEQKPEQEARRVEEKQQPKTGEAPTRPFPPQKVIGFVKRLAGRGPKDMATDGKRGATVGAMEALFPEANGDLKRGLRYSLLLAFFDVDSSKELTEGQADAILRWSSERNEADDGWTINPVAIIEAHRIIEARDEEAGQQKLV